MSDERDLTPRPAAAGPAASAIFAGVALLTVVTLGPAILLVGGAGRAPQAEQEAETPPRTVIAATQPTPPRRTAPAAAVRVLSASGRSTPAEGGKHRVTFVWTLEGAREGDQAVVHFYSGTTSLGEQRGALDRSVFAFSTGTFTLTAELDCSPNGWSAELLRVRDAPVDGDAFATVPGVACR